MRTRMDGCGGGALGCTVHEFDVLVEWLSKSVV